LLKSKAQNAVVLSLEVADVMIKKNTQKAGKAIQLLLHGIRFVSERLELLEHRATTNAGKPVSVLRGMAKTNVALPSLLVVCSVLV